MVIYQRRVIYPSNSANWDVYEFRESRLSRVYVFVERKLSVDCRKCFANLRKAVRLRKALETLSLRRSLAVAVASCVPRGLMNINFVMR